MKSKIANCNKKSVKLRIIGISVIIIVNLLINSSLLELLNNYNTSNQNNIEENHFTKHLKTSEIEYGRIHINNNWTQTNFTYPWCTGSGAWNDPFTIKNLTINGNGIDTCLLIENSIDYFKIENCTFYNSKRSSGTDPVYAGIELENVDNGIILNNTIYDVSEGITLKTCSNITISNNNITDTAWQGIKLFGSTNNTIAFNYASGCSLNCIQLSSGSNNNIIKNNTINNILGPGIELYSVNNNEITGNIVYCEDYTHSGNSDSGIVLSNCQSIILKENILIKNGLEVDGDISSFSSHTIETSNKINNKPLFYYVNEVGLTQDNFSTPGQIILANCSYSNISDLTLSNTSIPFAMFYCDNNTIKNITTDNVDSGIWLRYSSNNHVTENFFNGSSRGGNEIYSGIYMYESYNNNLTKNNITSFSSAIGLRSCDFNNISRNILYDGSDGIRFTYQSEYNLIHNNTIKLNQWGIYLWQSSFNNITKNNISNNIEGIRLEYCQNNSIFNNSILNNRQYGLIINYNNYNNTISANNFDNNRDYGIYSAYSSDNEISEFNNIIGNNISNSVYGIYLKSKFFRFSNNSLENCGIFLSGKLGEMTSHDIDTSNKVSGKNVYYYVNITGLKPINFTNPGQILIVNSNNSIISNFDMGNGTSGISLYYCNDSLISNNSISNQKLRGIYLADCKNITVLENKLSNIDNEYIYQSRGVGIYLEKCSESNIIWNNITDSYSGIELSSSGYNNISENTLTNNSYAGIYVVQSSNNSVSRNTAINTAKGIYLSQGDNQTLFENKMTGCGVKLSGSYDEISSHKINVSNNVNGKPILFYIDEIGLIINRTSNAGQVIFVNCNNSQISNLNLSYSTNGISLHYSFGNTISNITASYNTEKGISISGDNNNISNNTINFNEGGISVSYCNRTIISGNTIRNNTRGIIIASSSNSNVSENIITNNSYAGIYLLASFGEIVRYNNFFGNIIENSRQYGILLFDYWGHGYIEYNLFFNNCFINNNKHVDYYFHYSGISTNYWNNSLIGNYWDNYSGLDITPLDGIGDSPHNITQEPLMKDYLPIYEIPIQNGTKIHIDGNGVNALNWSRFAYLKWWFSGSGTYSNPYIIEDLIINGQNSGSCILIENSNAFFRIENCTVYNSGSIQFVDAGIKLNNTTNGMLINNTAKDNNYYGIFLDNSNNSLIYNNIFIQNTVHAWDNGSNNQWDNGFIGNIWDDYAGVDANDDGIGDTPYIISGTAGSQDNFPIWTDGDSISPVITIISPLSASVFGLVAPNYNISIEELNLDTFWYTLDGGTTNYTITGLTGTLNQLAWYALSVGSVTIRFYANDTAGNLGFKEVSVQKALEYWVLSPFVIDDTGAGDFTWAQAATQGWCGGSGTWSNPYIIEYVIINGQNSGSCIEIRNSNMHFIIRNSVMSYSGSGDFDAGIKLSNVTNGLLININCSSNNNYGIILIDCFNNTITESTINDNSVGGILLYYSDYNSIIDNDQTIQNNGKYGILLNSSDYNIISGNYISNCQYGIYFYDSSENQIIYNIFVGNDVAIEETEGSGNNNFDGNDGIPSDGEPLFPPELLIIISIIAIAAVVSAGGAIVYKKKVSLPKKKKQLKPKLEKGEIITKKKLKIEKGEDKKKLKLEKQRKKIENKLQKKLTFVDDLIKENKTEIALKNLNEIVSLAKSNGLIEYVNKAEQKLIEIKKLELDTINRIKQTITNLGTKFSRLQLTDISEKSDIKDEVLIEKIIKEMLNKKEIRGEYFASSKALALEVTTPIITREKKKDLNVFLSYSTLDADHFEISRIVRRLELYSEISNVYFWEADSGANIVTFMEQTLQKTNVFVLFCTEHSIKSKAVEDEWQAAFQLRKEGLMKIVPVYEKDEHLPYLLKPILNVKFSKDDFDRFIQKLYEEILR